MSLSDETLMAFVDGELDATQCAEIERALASDAPLRARVDTLRAQRRRVEAAFAAVLDEPMPTRLSALLAGAPAAGSATVVPPAPARAARKHRGAFAGWGWAQWGGMAASVVLGLLIGLQLAGRDDGIAVRDGRLVAVGAVEQALSTQLASAAGAAPAVAVQLSFVDRDGAYCRTFSTAAVAGLACRSDDGRWALQSVAAAASAPDGAMRQAETALPRAVLEVVDQRIAGNALDAAAERQARDGGWRR
jgi:hypothetical protein